jgi:SAM-dependent methyltransferase
MTSQTWPKVIPPLTPDQQAISDDFMRYWHEVLPKRFGLVEAFNHGHPVTNAPAEFLRTLEIGAGLGTHLEYERLTPDQERNYVSLDFRPNMVEKLKQRYPGVQTLVADCQERLDFVDGYFDRILAIHVLEHLPNLPAAVRELRRLCDSNRGILSVVIPCEGGLAYSMARKVSAQRYFEKRYKQSYRWFIEREHINRPHEIFQELDHEFSCTQKTWFPLHLPSVSLNLCIGMTLRPRPIPA